LQLIDNMLSINYAYTMELPTDPLSVFTRSVFTANGLLLRAGEAIAQQHKQSVARWHVLGRANHKSRTVPQIARYVGVSRQSVQRIANDLKKEGLIVYVPNPVDKRTQLIRITSKGRKILGELYGQDKVWSAHVTAELDAKSLVQLSQSIDAINSVLARHLGMAEHDKA
jgi:DNA-binding MarR family transcriptional regulator